MWCLVDVCSETTGFFSRRFQTKIRPRVVPAATNAPLFDQHVVDKISPSDSVGALMTSSRKSLPEPTTDTSLTESRAGIASSLEAGLQEMTPRTSDAFESFDSFHNLLKVLRQLVSPTLQSLTDPSQDDEATTSPAALMATLKTGAEWPLKRVSLKVSRLTTFKVMSAEPAQIKSPFRLTSMEVTSES